MYEQKFNLNEVFMKTKLQELWSRSKTLLWGTFWVALTFFVDNFSQVFIGVSLPDITTTVFGLVPQGITINSAVLLGLFLNQVSKYIHNRNEGKVE